MSNSLRMEMNHGVALMKALASPLRVQILELLCTEQLSVSDIAKRLRISQPATTIHVQKLEEVGLIHCALRSVNGSQSKMCSRLYDSIVLHLPSAEVVQGHQYYEINMPIGLFKRFDARGSLGLVTETDAVGQFDDPDAFLDPQRVFAQLLWMSAGYVEYEFPNEVPANSEISRLDISLEICSEARYHNDDWPSDITFWVNGKEVGTWTSPGDFGGTRGRLTPVWWHNVCTQYGLLKKIQIDDKGSYVDGVKMSEVNLQDLIETPQNGSKPGPMTLRVGVKEDAENAGGFNLFGENFGNHPQNIVLRVRYKAANGDTVNGQRRDMPPDMPQA